MVALTPQPTDLLMASFAERPHRRPQSPRAHPSRARRALRRPRHTDRRRLDTEGKKLLKALAEGVILRQETRRIQAEAS